MNRSRIRDLGIQIGSLPTGQYNAITDVPGVLVGHTTLIEDTPGAVRTGVTVILPRKEIGHDYAFAGFHRFNGCGEMTGIHWLEETGLLSSAIGITNTRDVGMLRDAMSEYSERHGDHGAFWLPVAAETYDGWLNDMGVRTLTKEHVFQAFDQAAGGAVDEGNVGGGTGMICHDFKGGIGTSSRIVETGSGTFTVGALVQANHGSRNQLRVNGVPVGLEIGQDKVPGAWVQPPLASSIIIIVATDAPLLADQCRRLAQRATVGLARVGGNGHNTSGDLFLAFSTAYHIPAQADGLISLGPMLPNRQINELFDGVAEAVEESILNALAAAETMTGAHGRTVYALPLDQLKQVIERYQPVLP